MSLRKAICIYVRGPAPGHTPLFLSAVKSTHIGTICYYQGSMFIDVVILGREVPVSELCIQLQEAPMIFVESKYRTPTS